MWPRWLLTAPLEKMFSAWKKKLAIETSDRGFFSLHLQPIKCDASSEKKLQQFIFAKNAFAIENPQLGERARSAIWISLKNFSIESQRNKQCAECNLLAHINYIKYVWGALRQLENEETFNTHGRRFDCTSLSLCFSLLMVIKAF